jgi:hypothetical protein
MGGANTRLRPVEIRAVRTLFPVYQSQSRYAQCFERNPAGDRCLRMWLHMAQCVFPTRRLADGQ